MVGRCSSLLAGVEVRRSLLVVRHSPAEVRRSLAGEVLRSHLVDHNLAGVVGHRGGIPMSVRRFVRSGRTSVCLGRPSGLPMGKGAAEVVGRLPCLIAGSGSLVARGCHRQIA